MPTSTARDSAWHGSDCERACTPARPILTLSRAAGPSASCPREVSPLAAAAKVQLSSTGPVLRVLLLHRQLGPKLDGPARPAPPMPAWPPPACTWRNLLLARRGLQRHERLWHGSASSCLRGVRMPASVPWLWCNPGCPARCEMGASPAARARDCRPARDWGWAAAANLVLAPKAVYEAPARWWP